MPKGCNVTSGQENDICRLYRSGTSYLELARQYGLCSDTIYNILARNGIDRNVHRNRLDTEQRSLILLLNREGQSSYEISKQTGIPASTIRERLRNDLNPKPKVGRSKALYQFNESYFASIDSEEKSYWIGFLLAELYVDGSPKAYGRMELSLSTKDAEHVHRFAKAIQATHPIRRYRYPHLKVPKDNTTLNLFSRTTTADLSRLFIGPNKTFTARWPEIDRPLTRHLVRGIFDGDGSVLISRNSVCYNFLGTEDVIVSIRLNLMNDCNLRPNKITHRNGVYHVAYAGNKQCVRIANYFYEDATIFLPRKRDIVLDHYRSLPKYRDQLRFG